MWSLIMRPNEVSSGRQRQQGRGGAQPRGQKSLDIRRFVSAIGHATRRPLCRRANQSTVCIDSVGLFAHTLQGSAVIQRDTSKWHLAAALLQIDRQFASNTQKN